MPAYLHDWSVTKLPACSPGIVLRALQAFLPTLRNHMSDSWVSLVFVVLSHTSHSHETPAAPVKLCLRLELRNAAT